MDHVSFSRLQEALTLPKVIRDVIPVDALGHIFFWYPEVRKDDVFVVLVHWREHQHKGRNIRSGGQVQTSVADTSLQLVFVGSKGAFIPFLHWHPADGLFDPLIEPELPEAVLLGGILLSAFTGSFHLVDADRNAEGRICLLPDLRVCPVVAFVSAVDHRIKGWVDFHASQNILCFLMRFIAD